MEDTRLAGACASRASAVLRLARTVRLDEDMCDARRQKERASSPVGTVLSDFPRVMP